LTSKVHLVCDGRGRPLSWVITGGNINDTTMMAATLDQIRVPRPVGRPRQRPDRVIADKGYPSKEPCLAAG
jgi:transposase